MRMCMNRRAGLAACVVVFGTLAGGYTLAGPKQFKRGKRKATVVASQGADGHDVGIASTRSSSPEQDDQDGQNKRATALAKELAKKNHVHDIANMESLWEQPGGRDPFGNLQNSQGVKEAGKKPGVVKEEKATAVATLGVNGHDVGVASTRSSSPEQDDQDGQNKMATALAKELAEKNHGYDIANMESKWGQPGGRDPFGDSKNSQGVKEAGKKPGVVDSQNKRATALVARTCPFENCKREQVTEVPYGLPRNLKPDQFGKICVGSDFCIYGNPRSAVVKKGTDEMTRYFDSIFEENGVVVNLDYSFTLGMQKVHHFFTENFTAPRDEAMDFLFEAGFSKKNHIYVNCGHGHGRTGTGFAAAVLGRKMAALALAPRWPADEKRTCKPQYSICDAPFKAYWGALGTRTVKDWIKEANEAYLKAKLKRPCKGSECFRNLGEEKDVLRDYVYYAIDYQGLSNEKNWTQTSKMLDAVNSCFDIECSEPVYSSIEIARSANKEYVENTVQLQALQTLYDRQKAKSRCQPHKAQK